MSDSETFVSLHYNTARSKTLNRLREEPVAGDVDLPSGGPARDIICWLNAPSGSRRGPLKGRGYTTTVYYLYGDERRAIRRFIDVNEEYVRSCIEDHQRSASSNPLQKNWDPILWQILLEEWDFRVAERGEQA